MVICLVPWPDFSQAPEDSLLAHLCRFAVRSPLVSAQRGAFLGSLVLRTRLAARHGLSGLASKLRLPRKHPTALNRDVQHPAALTFSVPPASTTRGGFGILTEFPSSTPFGLDLGSDSPRADEPPPGNLGLTAGRFLTCLIATHIGISSRRTSIGPFGPTSPALQRSPTAEPLSVDEGLPGASVPCLSPVIFSARPRLTSELLRFL